MANPNEQFQDLTDQQIRDFLIGLNDVTLRRIGEIAKGICEHDPAWCESAEDLKGQAATLPENSAGTLSD